MKTSPLKLLMTADTVGGVWTYAIELARALAPEGVRIVLASMGPLPSDEQRATAASAGNVELHARDLALEWMPDPWPDVEAAGSWLLELAGRVRADLVHLNQYAFGDLEFGVPKLVVGHSCVCSWHLATRGSEAGAECDRYRREVAQGLRGADLVTAPTFAMLAELRRQYGFFRAAPAVPNGRAATTSVDAPVAAVRKEPFVFAAGRLWDEGKNVAALARVAQDLPWPVRLAGDRQHPRGGEISWPGVDLLGRLDSAEVWSFMQRAAIYALPARYEPFGLSVLEAAMAGCALVLGDIESLRELWDGAALFVPPGDDAALRETLSRLATKPTLREQFAATARLRATRFTPERMAGGYLDLYRRLIGVPEDLGLQPERSR